MMGSLWQSKPNIEKLGRKDDVEGLTRALRYSDVLVGNDGRAVDLGAPVRRAAIRALRSIDGDQAGAALAGALDDPDPAVRLEAVRALVAREEAITVERLIEVVLTWPDPPYGETRREALNVLAVRADRAVAERFAAALVAAESAVAFDAADRQPAVDALLGIGDEAGPSETVIATLIRGLGSEHEVVRHNVQTVLDRFPAGQTVEPLIAALEDGRVRSGAALALGAIKDSRAVPSLIEALDARDSAARTAAAWALGEILDPRGVSALFKATSDSEYGVRSAATAALEKFGSVALVVLLDAGGGHTSRSAADEESGQP